MSKTFLSAEWRKLILANYQVDPTILKKYLPSKTELDLWNGICYVSLVGFMFQNTKVLGLKIPFHVNFEEVNLRFYVKHKSAKGEWRRGVVFIKEIVPKSAITFVANNLYKEHYQTLEMSHRWENNEMLETEYAWQYNNRWNRISVKTDLQSKEIAEGSEAEFISEHYWGYTKNGENRTSEYEVRHPRWEVYHVKEYEIDVDFGAVYGSEFSVLTDQQPKSIFLAEGSEISVHKDDPV